MFTGIVEELGAVSAVEIHPDGARLTFEAAKCAHDLAPGDSISVNGVCLTAVDPSATGFSADVMQQTLKSSSLGALAPGDRVNLERARAIGDRLGGHIVQGHVDGVAVITHREPSEHWVVVRFETDPHIARYLVPKGSVTVDGVSLTVVDVNDTTFSVSLIPTTLAETTLGLKESGESVNVEVDVIAKYVEKLVTR